MNGTASEAKLIGVDWGTTQLRVYRIGDIGAVLDRRESDSGISSVPGRDFDTALRTLVADWVETEPSLPIAMCGMIGSRQGWREAPSFSCPVSIRDLAAGLQPIGTSLGTAWIAGGVSVTDGNELIDIMRGEEIQILGIDCYGDEWLVVTPGTHSKWVILRGETICGFRTYMTGELYALLRRHSILSRLMPEDVEVPVVPDAFLEGVLAAADDSQLLRVLFSVRTGGLTHRPDASALASYLSDILIGAEISGALQWTPRLSVLVVASPTLGPLYQRAFPTFGVRAVRHIGAEQAVAKGLWRVWTLPRDGEIRNGG